MIRLLRNDKLYIETVTIQTMLFSWNDEVLFERIFLNLIKNKIDLKPLRWLYEITRNKIQCI